MKIITPDKEKWYTISPQELLCDTFWRRAIGPWVYIARHKTQTVYIGSTENMLYSRIREHIITKSTGDLGRALRATTGIITKGTGDELYQSADKWQLLLWQFFALSPNDDHLQREKRLIHKCKPLLNVVWNR